MNTNTNTNTKAKAKLLVGCNLGYRIAAKNCDPETLQALRDGENAVLRRARIHNGCHPDYQNGKTLAHGWFTLAQKGYALPA